MLVFFFSIYFITNVWIKWSASPMIITLSAYATPISDFPFPGTKKIIQFLSRISIDSLSLIDEIFLSAKTEQLEQKLTYLGFCS